jgi:hypothetical protein
MSTPGQPAVVCGERMAGLLTARALSDFMTARSVERDLVPDTVA